MERIVISNSWFEVSDQFGEETLTSLVRKFIGKRSTYLELHMFSCSILVKFASKPTPTYPYFTVSTQSPLLELN